MFKPTLKFILIFLWVFTNAPLSIAEDVTISSDLVSPTGKYVTINSTEKTLLATDASKKVTIGAPDGTPASSHALLKIMSTTKGVMLPRVVSTTRRDDGTYGIPKNSANNSMLILNERQEIDATGASQRFEYYDDSIAAWKVLGGTLAGDSEWWDPVVGTNGDIQTKNLVSGKVGIGTYQAVVPPSGFTVRDGAVLFWQEFDDHDTSAHESGGAYQLPIGTGTRLLWLPSTESFYSGSVGNEYDWSNIQNNLRTFVAGNTNSVKASASFVTGLQNTVDSCGAVGGRKLVMGESHSIMNAKEVVVFGFGNQIGGVNCGDSPKTLDKVFLLGQNLLATREGEIMIGSGNSANSKLVANTTDTGGNDIKNGIIVGLNSATPTLVMLGNRGFVGINAATGDWTSLTNQLLVKGQGGSQYKMVRANGYWYTSDARFKTQIQPLGSVLDKLKSIRAVRFDWKDAPSLPGDSSSPKNIGVLAQEVEKEFPELVSNIGEYKAVDYGKLNTVLVQAVKELKEKNDNMRMRIDRLKKELAPNPA